MNLWSEMMTCLIKGCFRPRDFTGHHLKHKGSGGSDGPWNRLGFCRVHHSEYHQIGRSAFIEKYPESKFLIERAESVELIWQRWLRGEIGEDALKDYPEILNYIKHRFHRSQ